MRWNVVEIAENERYVKLYRGFLVVMENEIELGRVIIDEMSCLLLTAERATLSKPIMVRLAEYGVPIVVCGRNYHPIALSLPYTAHHQSARVLRQQIAASLPLKKRLWQALIKTKIEYQRQTLLLCRPEETTVTKQLERLCARVRSGDPDNGEAQASRIYWQALMGQEFRRREEGEGPVNAALNYGYSVARAACARALLTAGLNPSLGLHHHNQNNPFCLADDIMEIYRPLVDHQVFYLGLEGEFNNEHKQALARILQADVIVGEKRTTVNTSMQILATSLANSYANRSMELRLFEREAG